MKNPDPAMEASTAPQDKSHLDAIVNDLSIEDCKYMIDLLEARIEKESSTDDDEMFNSYMDSEAEELGDMSE